MAIARTDTFGNQLALEVSLSTLCRMLVDKGVSTLYAKRLSTNDNSKNQIYFGGDFSSLNIIPVSSLELFNSSSTKTNLKPGKPLIQGTIRFSWIDHSGQLHPAPAAKLILYPQYPEVRFSGFLKGSNINASEWMDVAKQGRSDGRYLLIGIHPEGYCVGYLAVPGSRISKELDLTSSCMWNSLLNEVPLDNSTIISSREKLLRELRRIHNSSPISGKKLDKKSGLSTPYNAPNGAGYTLEAELGIAPNGYAEPDYEGWELKAHGSDVVTLMTPEPTGGIYQSRGVDFFIRNYGYPDKNGKPDRINFGGIHKTGERQASTGLTMLISGYTLGSKVIDPNGGIVLIDDNDTVAAEWGFFKLLEHWNKKHAKAAYIPYKREVREEISHYFFSNTVNLGEGTDFLMFLKAFSLQSIYLDPGIKLVGESKKNPEIKRRSQFRIKFKNLSSLYMKWDEVELLN